jgi:hypothetical protein
VGCTPRSHNRCSRGCFFGSLYYQWNVVASVRVKRQGITHLRLFLGPSLRFPGSYFRIFDKRG